MPGFVESSGATPSQRKSLFYGVCLPLRILLAYTVYLLSDSPLIRGFVGVSSALSFYTILLSLELGSAPSGIVWWSREIHLVTSALTFFLVVGGRVDLVPVVMVVDILYGLVTSFARDPWALISV